MSTVLPPSLADFCGVLSESKRIISAHSRHFLALSVLFILPLSFSLAVFPILFSSSSSSIYNHVSVHALRRLSSTSASFPPPHHRLHLHISLETLTFVLIFAVFIFFLSLAASASVTFSVFHGFYGRPVKLGFALSSLSRSFLRLLATSAAALIAFSFVFAAFAFYEFVAWKGFELIAGADRTPIDSVWFLAISSIGALIFALAFTGLSVNWILMSAVVVIESRWGFDGLFRSKRLVGGMKRTGLSLISFFGVTSSLLLWISWISSSDAGNSGNNSSVVVVFSSTVSDGDWWRNWAFVVQIVVTSAILTVILLHGIAASTVFYMYCKAVRGELADEIAKEFAAEYVSLPFDDDKVPHLVSIVNH